MRFISVASLVSRAIKLSRILILRATKVGKKYPAVFAVHWAILQWPNKNLYRAKVSRLQVSKYNRLTCYVF